MSTEIEQKEYGDFWGGNCVATNRYYSFGVNPFSVAQVAICLREVKPNLNMILLTWVSTVRSLTTSMSAISRLYFMRAISAATSRSRAVSPPKACLAACFGESSCLGGNMSVEIGR